MVDFSHSLAKRDLKLLIYTTLHIILSTLQHYIDNLGGREEGGGKKDDLKNG